MHISLNFKTCCNLKIGHLGAKLWLFHYFHFERSYDKSNSPCILLIKTINFNKNETESKMGNPAHSFRETNLVLQLIWESQIKSENVMSWSLQKKKLDPSTSFCCKKKTRKGFLIFWNNSGDKVGFS